MEQYKNFFERIFCKGEINEFYELKDKSKNETASTIKSDTSSLNTSILADLSQMQNSNGTMDLFFEDDNKGNVEFGALFLNDNIDDTLNENVLSLNEDIIEQNILSLEQDAIEQNILSLEENMLLTEDNDLMEFDGVNGIIDLNEDFINLDDLEESTSESNDLDESAKSLIEMLKTDITQINEASIDSDETDNENDDLDIPML